MLRQKPNAERQMSKVNLPFAMLRLEVKHPSNAHLNKLAKQII